MSRGCVSIVLSKRCVSVVGVKTVCQCCWCQEGVSVLLKARGVSPGEEAAPGPVDIGSTWNDCVEMRGCVNEKTKRRVRDRSRVAFN